MGKKIAAGADEEIDESEEIDEEQDEDQDEQDSSDDGDDEQGSDDDENDDNKDENAGFEGEFDAKRARNTIGRLRRELKKAKEAKVTPAKGSAELTKVQQENLRLRVALRAGLDDDLADRLRGSTEEELLEDAQKLIDRFYPVENEKKKLETRQPKPRLKGGSKPNEDPDVSAADIVKEALGR